MKKLLSLIIIAIIANTAYAGFPIGRGKYLLVPSYNLYTTKGYWDAAGTYIPFSNGGRFASHYFGIYGGIGIGERLDFVGNISLELMFLVAIVYHAKKIRNEPSTIQL